jgi:hypothetical protein
MVPKKQSAHSLVALTLGLFLVAFLLARQTMVAPPAAPSVTSPSGLDRSH